MSFEKIIAKLTAQLGDEIVLDLNEEVSQPYFVVAPDRLIDVCQVLFRDKDLLFDYLACITGVDLHPKSEEIEIIYHLDSLLNKHRVVLKVRVPRLPLEDCKVPSVANIWRTANWHERETYDFFGVQFTDHPGLRRILLPANWEGHPLRKDYEEQEYYHGVKVKY